MNVLFFRHHLITRLAQKCKDWVRVFLAGLKKKKKKETPENREKHETGIKHVFHRICGVSYQHVANIPLLQYFLYLIKPLASAESLPGESIRFRHERC